MPGKASLTAARYYANPRNQFWLLVGAVVGEPLSDLPYQGRLERLVARGVGLWDVVAQAARQGSLDAALREVEANDLPGLVATLPELRAVAFNGKTAARIGHRLLGQTPLALVDLPSSSPAFTLPFAVKLTEWRALSPYVA